MRRKHDFVYALFLFHLQHRGGNGNVFRAVVDTGQYMRMKIDHFLIPPFPAVFRRVLFQIERHRRNIVAEFSAAEHGERVL